MILSLFSCKECPTEPEKVISLSISAPYIETSIVWLKILSTDSTHQKSYTIVRDSVVISEGTFIGKDTIIADRSVEPNTAYTYSVQYSKEISDPISVTTMDLSSSDFTWEVFYFGEATRNNILEDVSIVNENDIWVVGLIEVWGWDSLDSEYDWIRYNALHWDGQTWNLISISPPYSGAYDIVHTINDSVVWAGVNVPALFRNSIWSVCENAPHLGWMLDIWGNSLSNTYFTYYGGGIAHYNGMSFRTMESGTDVDLRDIDGNDERVYTVGCTGGTGNVVLEYEYTKNVWTTLLTSHTVNGNLETGDMGQFYSVKVIDDVAVITCAAMATLKYYYHDGFYDGISQESTILDECWVVEIIDGNAINDLALITEGGEIVHYNGQDFQVCYDYEDIYSHDIWILGGDYKDNTICAVGKAQGQGVVIIGRR